MPFDTSSSWGDSYKIAAKASPDWNPGGRTPGGAFNPYADWNPGGDVMEKYAGMPSFEESFTKNWNSKNFLNTWVDKLRDGSPASGQGSSSSGGSGGGAYGGGSSDNNTKQLLPGFSMYDPNAGKSLYTVSGMPGQDSPWKPVAEAALGLGMSFASPIVGAAGKAFAGKMVG